MLLLTRACEDLERERQEREEEKERYLGEKLPPLQMSGLSLDELQVRVISHRRAAFLTTENVRTILTPFSPPSQNLCKQLHSKIDVVDEERYDCESKVSKHNKDVSFGGPSSAKHDIQIILHSRVNICY